MKRLCVVMFGIALLAAGCGRRAADSGFMASSVNDFLLLRHVDFATEEADPQPAWSPNGRWLVVRSGRSLLLLREGGVRRHRLAGGRRAAHPVWLDFETLVFGPEDWMVTTEDGRIVNPSEGLRLLRVEANGLIDQTRGQDIATGAWRPRAWDGRIVAQFGAMIHIYDRSGDQTVYDAGFFPVPHPRGTGMALQTTPMIAHDHWTGNPELGDLVVRWPDGTVQLLPGCVEAAWTADGGLVATRLRSLPPQPDRWWEVGTDVVAVSGPGAPITVVMADARHPAPNPQAPLMTVMDAGGATVLTDLEGNEQRTLLDDRTRSALWSPDGTRLAVERVDPATGLVDLRVLIFKIRDR